MIKISSPEVQLRQNRNLLLLVGGCSTIAGLFLWSAMPFVFNNPKERINICFRYFALLGSLSCGIAAVATGHQLQRIAPLIKAIETAERNDFIDELASSQYVQQQRYQQEAIAALQAPLQNPMAQHNELSYNDRNDGIARDNEVSNESSERPVTDAMTPATDAAIDPAMEDYKPIYLSIIALQQQGMSDSDIIKDVLKQGGTNYQKGKQMLEALLQLGQSKQW